MWEACRALPLDVVRIESNPGSALLTLIPMGQWSNAVQMRVIKLRDARLQELLAELGQACTLGQEEDSLLLDGEKRAYLRGIQKAIASVHEASIVLARAIQRIEELGLPD